MCFHYDNKYGLGHHCKKLFHILIVPTDDKLNFQESEDDWVDTKEACNEQRILLTASIIKLCGWIDTTRINEVERKLTKMRYYHYGGL